jgi:plasmid maintenance system killer protein
LSIKTRRPNGEANRKMKRKVDLLAVALARQLGKPQYADHGRKRGNPHGWWSARQNGFTLERN